MSSQEQELQRMAGLSKAIAMVRTKPELLQVISATLQPVFGFSAADVLVRADATATRHRYLLEWSTRGADSALLTGRREEQFASAGSAYAWLLHLREPRWVSLAELLTVAPTDPGLPPLREANLQDSLVAALPDTPQPLGVLRFHYPAGPVPTGQLLLFAAVADQVAVVVANLLAHDELASREREKTAQLAISNALAQVRNRQELSLRLAQEMAQRLPYHICTLQLVPQPAAPVWFSSLRRLPAGQLVDVSAEWEAACPNLAELMAARAQVVPLISTILDGVNYARIRQQLAIIGFEHAQEGINSMLGVSIPLADGGRAIFVLSSQASYFFTTADEDLVRSLAPQIGLAVENLLAIERIEQLTQQLEHEKTYLMEEVGATHNFGEIVGNSRALGPVFRQVEQVAATDATVLIQGETGTGKELIARALHQRSLRRHKPLIKLNCATLPAQLIESELFGHEKGAFTGATELRRGKFELADGGTIFLDEIGELPLELQAKLLRVLQEREIERLGGQRVLAVDVRVIAATNRNLEQEVAAGRFRADLFYRLQVFPIGLPALRERTEDIPLLATHFATRYSQQLGKPFHGIKEGAMQQLLHYAWPGNIRELENLLEQAVIVCNGPLEWSRTLPAGPPPTDPFPVAPTPGAGAPPNAEPTAAAPAAESLKAHERAHVLAVLRQTNGRIRGVGGAAELLDVPPTTLESRIKRLRIAKNDIFSASIS